MEKRLRILKTLVIICFAVFVFLPHESVAAQIYYEKKSQETITDGVTYEKSTQIGESGLLDVHILSVDITKPNLEIKPVWQKSDYGARETVLSMANENGALAAVNGDFFDMEQAPVTPFGTVISDGRIISMDEEYTGFSTFFIDDGNNPIIEYITPDIKFYNNGQENMKVHAINKYKRDFNAVYFDSTAIKDTSTLDQKFPDLVKFVVRNGYITYVSKGGETVAAPEDGYIIVAAATYAVNYYSLVKVGDSAELKIEARFDMEKVKSAIGGAGKILENGIVSESGYVASPNGRNPRTAIGINQDNTRIIMMCVDGRNHSVGATHAEMAEIMKRYGAWNAMHLDGGGSTTMVVDSLEKAGLVVANSPAGGSLRKVVNGIGVFNTDPIGGVTAMHINVASDKVFAQSPINVSAFGLDSNMRRIALPTESIQYLSSDEGGRFEGSVFYPSKGGVIVLAAAYNGLLAQKQVEILELAQLNPNKESLVLALGDSHKFSFTGISTTGISAPVNGVSYEVVPAELGEVVDGTFTVKGGKSGFIKCYIGNVASYVDVSVGTELRWVSGFNKPEDWPVDFIASSESVKGRSFLTDTPNKQGNFALGLEYSFGVSQSTQAAYLQFKNPVEFAVGINEMVVSVYGFRNGGWLRARLVDANDEIHVVDLAREFNHFGWAQLKAIIPDAALQPVRLDRIYIAALSNSDISTKTIYFDDLGGIYPAYSGTVEKPQNTAFKSPYQGDLTAKAPEGAFDITIAGNIGQNPEGKFTSLQNQALAGFIKDSSYKTILGGEFAGADNVYRGEYNFTKISNYAIVELSAQKGGIAATNPASWMFVAQAKAAPVNHVIIIMDKKPSNLSNAEYELFKSAAEEIRATGKTVFVVSAEGGLKTTQYIDGVNYVNLPGLLNDKEEKNPDFAILRIRINGGQISFQLQG